MKSVGGQILKGFKDHKVIYGSSTPRSIKDALKLDDVTGSDCWRRVIEEELERVRVNLVQVAKGSLVKTRHAWYHLVRSSQSLCHRMRISGRLPMMEPVQKHYDRLKKAVEMSAFEGGGGEREVADIFTKLPTISRFQFFVEGGQN